jgi:hypothetical protein
MDAVMIPNPTDEEIEEWMTLFIMYRNHGKASLSADTYARFKVLTEKMSKLYEFPLVLKGQ